MSKVKFTSSFTLIELLIVIGILAILTAAVVIILNPGELLKEARDSSRMSDLASISKTVQLLLTQNPSVNLGTAQTVYISIPDPSSSTCASITGLPVLPSGYSYHCVTSANSTNINGTGWIPIDFTAQGIQNLSKLPVDPTNSASQLLYYAYTPGTNGTFDTYAYMESKKYITQTAVSGSSVAAFEKGTGSNLFPNTFPSGWIKVPGNSTFGTSDFYVMQYAASQSGTLPVSTGTTGAYPWVNISQTTSSSTCALLGSGFHLFTNNEYQTIAWNLENNPVNWSGGTVGSGYMSRGNSDSGAAQDGSSPYGTGYTDFTHLRTQQLSTGATIWDMAGNVWEWTNDTITGANQPSTVTPGFAWRQFTAITTWGTMTQQTAGPANNTWNSSQNIGQIYSDGTASNSTVYGFLRGGLWFVGSYAGVETLVLSNAPGNTSSYVGFRCAR
jgi:formylglycine-generating enzyme required for sulfatase activity/Tfp pilus assembly protein PilE